MSEGNHGHAAPSVPSQGPRPGQRLVEDLRVSLRLPRQSIVGLTRTAIVSCGGVSRTDLCLERNSCQASLQLCTEQGSLSVGGCDFLFKLSYVCRRRSGLSQKNHELVVVGVCVRGQLAMIGHELHCAAYCHLELHVRAGGGPRHIEMWFNPAVLYRPERRQPKKA